MSDLPLSRVEYHVRDEGFGGPYDLTINGQPVVGLQMIETHEADQEFHTVTIRLGGVSVSKVVDPPR